MNPAAFLRDICVRTDLTPKKDQVVILEPDPEPEPETQTEPEPEPPVTKFEYEVDMVGHFALNLDLLEPDMHLYQEAGGPGIEHPCNDAFNRSASSIDILAIDRNGDFVVIECKVKRGQPAVLGQVLGYIAWIKNNLLIPSSNEAATAPDRPKVRAIIVVKAASALLKLALKELNRPEISVFEYVNALEVRRVL